MMLNGVPQSLTSHFPSNAKIIPVAGGSINQCYKITSDNKSLFLKTNSARKFPGMFGAEKKGLELLRKSTSFRIPVVIDLVTTSEESYLILEWIDTDSSKKSSAEGGRALANMHKNTQPFFGLDHNNYIGSLPQHNETKTSWADFFRTQRLESLINLGLERRLLPNDIKHWFEPLFKKTDQLFPEESPALLHGDLWSGNYMSDSNSKPVLIDPAVYFGHREMDLAMTKMFGGFDEKFYSAYQETWPLEPGYKERTDVCNLYPLLVHAILFGESYLWQIKQILKKF